MKFSNDVDRDAILHVAFWCVWCVIALIVIFMSPAFVSPADAQIINPPKEIRQANYGSSCAHAATITMLNWQEQPEMGAWWRKAYRGGETFYGLSSKAVYAKLDYAILRNGKLGILEYATATKRGAVVDWSGKRGIYRTRFGEGGHHAVFFLGFSGNTASIIDPNTRRIHTFTREAFLAWWRHCGGRSFMTLYSPKQ